MSQIFIKSENADLIFEASGGSISALEKLTEQMARIPVLSADERRMLDQYMAALGVYPVYTARPPVKEPERQYKSA